VNPILEKYADQILPPSDGDTCSAPTSIFVPLCGKTIDMAYLAKQASVKEVVGIDGIRKALEEFAQEQPELEVSPQEQVGKYERFVGNKITLLKGDLFEFDELAAGGRFGAIFDRASMVAIQPALRKDYVSVMGKVIAPGGKILLVTIERKGSDEEAVNKGPPFSLSEQVVLDLYEGEDWVESISLLEQEDMFVKEPEQKARYEGLDGLMELTFLIQAKA
jgi:thiopurine S-methyltransferase